MIDLSGYAVLKKTDLSLSQKITAAISSSAKGSGLCVHLDMGLARDWNIYIGIVRVIATPVSSYVQLHWCVWKTLFS